MPALTIPACGYGAGSKPITDAGIESAIAVGGSRRGFSDYDATKRDFVLVFSRCTAAEFQAQDTLYESNKLTGGMTFTPPWSVSSITADYTAPPDIDFIANSPYVVVTLRLRQQ